MAIGKPFAKDIESACGASLHEQPDSGIFLTGRKTNSHSLNIILKKGGDYGRKNIIN
jgi:hypothetical protein